MSGLGLRGRLMLAVGAVVVAAVAAVGLVAERATRVEFHKLLKVENETQGPASGPGVDPGPLAEAAARAYAEGGWPLVSQRLAARIPEVGAEQALVLDPGDRLVAASSPDAAGLSFETDGGAEMTIHRTDGPRQETFHLRTPFAPIRGPDDGEVVGHLYVIPLPGAPDAPGLFGPQQVAARPRDLFLGSVNRWILGAVLAVGLLALALTFFTTRHLLRPIRELTTAAGELAAGRLDRRVKPRSDDEIGELTRAFNTMAANLERNEQLRRNMVSDTAHELRTPITNLRCQIEALEDGVLQPGPEVTASLGEEIRALQALVEDLQELALAEAGRLSLDPRPVDLAAEVEPAVAVASARGSAARIETDLGRPLAVEADPRRLRQILANLLANAVAHTPPDGLIRVSARALAREVEVTIADSGPGIEPEHLASVFERYYRTDASRQRETGGAGLGLAIVRQLVEGQGGRVWAESPPGGGAVFGFTLPRSGPLPAQPPAPPTEGVPSPGGSR